MNTDDNVVDLVNGKPHIVISVYGGNQHVIPVCFFMDVAKGRRSLKDLDGFDAVVPEIIREWLSTKAI